MALRKIIQLCGPDSRIAVCDDGTVWEWFTTGLSGRWQPWGRASIPQPIAVVVTETDDGPVVSDPMPADEAQQIVNSAAAQKFVELSRQQEPPPVPPGVPPAPGQSPADREEVDRRKRGSRR